MVDRDVLAELDAEGVLARAERIQAALVDVETERFFLAAQWVVLHPGEALEDERRRRGVRAVPGAERSRRVGADGTPWVAEFAVMELGAVLGMGQVAALCFVRDAVNVQHRHPVLWEALAAGEARVWQAREVAKRCAAAGLSLEQAQWVDAATSGYLVSLPWGRFSCLLDAKIVEVDPTAAEARRVAAAMARFVRTGQSSEFGLTTLVARAAAGDVVFFVAMVDRLAQILLEQGDADPVDVRRSKAIGILADPARALVMLTESAVRAAEAADAAGGPVAEGAAGPDGPEPDEPEPDDEAGDIARREWVAALARLRELAALDPGLLRALRPNAVLYVHVSAESLRTGGGVARMEGMGPLTIQQVREFLGHCHVRPVQVIDVAGQEPVDGYEVPVRMAEALRLRQPACASPWSVNLSRRKDADHVVAYRPRARGGPPGQTAMDNLALLGRFPHRVKTHGRWRLSQPEPGVFEWRSPHGYRFRVDHHGTRPLGRQPSARAGAVRRLAPIPGVELYEPAFPIEFVEGWEAG